MPLYRQLSEALRSCISIGRLKAGDPLPSSRDLSRMLGVGRNTIIRAYEELESQGYIKGSTGSGTFVSDKLPQTTETVAPGTQEKLKRTLDSFELSAYAQRLSESELIHSVVDNVEMSCGGPPAQFLPVNQWRELLSRHVKRGRSAEEYPYTDDALGYLPLREAIAGYLNRQRGLICDADQIAIFPAQLYTLDLIARLFVEPGTTVVLENPGFPAARQTFCALGARLHALPVDEEGLVAGALNSVEEGCRLAYVIPSHNDVTGAVMSADRRKQLLVWASKRKALLIEDDWDCEYRYGNPPISSLFGLDDSECVIYFGTFWRTLFPLSTIGFLVAPWSLMRTIAHAKALVEPTFPMLEQFALTDFIVEGHLERHIKRTRESYMKRRQALLFALSKHLTGRIVLNRESGGFHQCMRLLSDIPEEKLLQLASQAGLPMVATGPEYLGVAPKQEFIISFAHLDEDKVEEKVATFAALMELRNS